MPAGVPSRRRAPSLREAWRYAVPLGAAVVVAGGVLLATGVLRADATPPLPARSAAQLVADMATGGQTAGFSGTLVQKTSLGLPALPSETADASGDDAAAGLSLMSLLAGTNTVKVWCQGADRQRIAVLDPVGETDVFHHGPDVWQWDSSSRRATHSTLSPAAADRPVPAATAGAGVLTPSQLAQQLLAAVESTTHVGVGSDVRVAGRPAYRLTLTPASPDTRVGSVRIELDGQTRLPLGVQVFARGSSTAAVDVSFTSVDFAAPDPSNFDFSPPPGSAVTHAGSTPAVPALGAAPDVVGRGWSAVAVLRPRTPVGTTGMLDAVLGPVSGSWGSGRLLSAPLFSVLVLDDGRVLAGAVDPQRLYAVAG